MNWKQANANAFRDPAEVPPSQHSDMLEWWSLCMEGLTTELEGAEILVAHFHFVGDEAKMREWEQRRHCIMHSLMNAEHKVRRLLVFAPIEVHDELELDPFADE